MPSDPYLYRWYIIPRNRFFNIYLHKIIRDDDDRVCHDHPWWSISFMLKGCYREIRHTRKTRTLKSPNVVIREPSFAHRLEIVNGSVWTLFITGPKVKEWGFYCPKGWLHWTKFVDKDNPGAIGKGCGEYE